MTTFPSPFPPCAKTSCSLDSCCTGFVRGRSQLLAARRKLPWLPSRATFPSRRETQAKRSPLLLPIPVFNIGHGIVCFFYLSFCFLVWPCRTHKFLVLSTSKGLSAIIISNIVMPLGEFFTLREAGLKIWDCLGLKIRDFHPRISAFHRNSTIALWLHPQLGIRWIPTASWRVQTYGPILLPVYASTVHDSYSTTFCRLGSWKSTWSKFLPILPWVPGHYAGS